MAPRKIEYHPKASGDVFREMFPQGTPDMDSPDDMDLVNWGEIAYHSELDIEDMRAED